MIQHNRTHEGTDQRHLEQELQWLRMEKEPECRERLGQHDEQHSVEFQLALNELARVQARIDQLRELLAVPDTTSIRREGAVSAGTRVTVRDDSGKQQVFVMVSPLEAGIAVGHISTESPVGMALLGRLPGERVEAATPAGKRCFTVVHVEHPE